MNPVPGQLLGVLYEPYQVRFCADEAATLTFASECLVALLSPPGTEPSWGQPRPTEPILIALTGDLGAGKTTWVRGMAKVFGLEDQVHSPTYALKHEYGDPVSLQHLDLYRLSEGADFADLAELGLGESDSPNPTSPLITCVEWPERMPVGTVFNHWFHLAFASGEPKVASETEGRIITWYRPRGD